MSNIEGIGADQWVALYYANGRHFEYCTLYIAVLIRPL